MPSTTRASMTPPRSSLRLVFADSRLRSPLSEHTCEYAVLRAASGLLEQPGVRISPFYFWASHEGRSLNDATRRCSSARVLAAFPRRPRFLESDAENRVHFKVHSEILAFARCARSEGIVTLLGVPLVRSLAEYQDTADCAFFTPTEPIQDADKDTVYRLDPDDGSRATPASTLAGPLSPAEVEWSSSLTRARPPDEDTAGVLRSLHREALPRRHFLFGSRCRPIYLLLRTEDGSAR